MQERRREDRRQQMIRIRDRRMLNLGSPTGLERRSGEDRRQIERRSGERRLMRA